MSIKIKNKSKESAQDGKVELDWSKMDRGGQADQFERATMQAASWIEENRRLLAIGASTVVVVILGAFLFLNYAKGQQVEASNRLSEGLAAYSTPVEGSPLLEAIRAQQGGPTLDKTFSDATTKWSEIEAQAEATLSDFDRGPIAASARLTKASAAMNLGRYEEAAGLYRQVLSENELDANLEAMATVGLADTLAASGDLDGANEAWQNFLAQNPDRQSYVELEIARQTERYGEPAKAKALYEAYLNDHPESEYRDEVARRLALL